MSRTTNLRLLLVEPDDDIRDLFTSLLMLAGCEVVAAKGGVEVLAIIEASMPDVILSELMLRDIAVFDFCKQVRSFPNAENMFFVALTGFWREGIEQEVLKAGFDLFMIKPVRLEQLVDVLLPVAIERGCNVDQMELLSSNSVCYS
jgi:two-component system CheB/CheR fusion protein